MKPKTKVMIIADIVSVVSMAVLCVTWDFSAAWVKAVFSVVFFVSVVTAGCIACTYEGGQDDDF